MSHWPTQKEKTQQAFRAYLELLHTADWLRAELRPQLEAFDLTMAGFRLLEMLYREGTVSQPLAAQELRCRRQNLNVIIAGLEQRRWVQRAITTYAPVEVAEGDLPKAKRGPSRVGKRVGVISLTPLGKKFIGNVLPRHAKMVKALMRVLEGREKESLIRICQKLREGDVVKYISELTHEDVEE
jgi:DNA-binding MarR family transcriptional regulator